MVILCNHNATHDGDAMASVDTNVVSNGLGPILSLTLLKCPNFLVCRQKMCEMLEVFEEIYLFIISEFVSNISEQFMEEINDVLQI